MMHRELTHFTQHTKNRTVLLLFAHDLFSNINIRHDILQHYKILSGYSEKISLLFLFLVIIINQSATVLFGWIFFVHLHLMLSRNTWFKIMTSHYFMEPSTTILNAGWMLNARWTKFNHWIITPTSVTIHNIFHA